MKIKNLSKGQEDFFIITIEKEEMQEINILVDGGKSGSRCVKETIESGVKKIDYIVLTHIDSDHIQGLLMLLKKYENYNDTIIIYNKFINGLISYRQAEKFEKLIEKKEIIVSYKEYQDNSGMINFLSVNQRKKLVLDNKKVYFTFLSPDQDKVKNLYDYYSYYIEKGKKRTDDAEIVNRSSIMFILEYQKKSILMTGDGYISDILQSIEQLADPKETVQPIIHFDLIKLPHHGSTKNNLGISELLKYIPCNKFIITNEDDGSVSISDEIKNMPSCNRIYCSNYSQKYEGMNVIITNEIKVNNEY